MVAVKLSVYIGEDRRVTIQLPDNVPVGSADLEVNVHSVQSKHLSVRERLMAAELLTDSDALGIPKDVEYISDEELDGLGVLSPGARPSEELIDEDRGHY